MNKKRTLAVTSTSVLAASMAQGAVVYTGVNVQLIPDQNQVYSYPFDLDGNSSIDFVAAFHNHNQNKPYIECRPSDLPAGISSTLGWTLSNNHVDTGNSAYWGAAVTPFGTAIDATFATTNAPQKTAYLYQDWENQTLGDWPINGVTDAFVGLAIIDDANFTTNFGYAHLILNGTASPKTLTLVGYGYETQAGKGIIAGAQVTPAEPVIYTQPTSQTIGAGNSAQFKVQALADPAPAYQWRAAAVGSGSYTNLLNDGHFTGVDTATLDVNTATLADNLDFQVIVSNGLGSATSAPPARLTVISTILEGPTPSTARIFQGQDARFDISVVSGVPSGYQWRKGGVNLTDGAKYSGTTSSNLLIKNLTGADDGSFDVIVNGLGGATTSPIGTLTTVPTNGGAFEASTLATGAKIYYRLNETDDTSPGTVLAYDNAGGKNGLYGTTAQNGGPSFSIAGPRPADGFHGFHSTNTALRTVKNDKTSVIKAAPWNLNTNIVTITAWIKPEAEPTGSEAVVFTRSTNLMVCGIAFYSGLFAPPPFALGYNWNDAFETWSWNSGLYPPTNKWSFVSLVVTPTNAVVRMMYDGQVFAATNTIAHSVQSWNDAVYIGTDPDDLNGGRNFSGSIDEVSVFKRALSDEDLFDMYYVALTATTPVRLKIQMAGNQAQLTWPRGTLLEATSISGPWTTNANTSPYLLTPTDAQKFFRVQVQ
ncbi:MAG: hypothetical protein QM813_09075 [Verrucomicrobiota bacterium]